MATGVTPSAAIYSTSTAPSRQAHHFPLRRHFRTPGPLLPHLFVPPPPGSLVPSPPPPPGSLAPPPPPPPGSIVLLPLPLPKPTTNLAENICANVVPKPAAKTKKGPGPAKAHPTHTTARNLCLAVYAVDVGGTTAEFALHWRALVDENPPSALFKAYSKELKRIQEILK
ncbi:hypothetical protein B0H14DRAFT_3885514 [Mycena olivaceomarginata]|nr:hypothetical protein B0H14DRAFT_3885514 [Mycena olivaceomarginata]